MATKIIEFPESTSRNQTHTFELEFLQNTPTLVSNTGNVVIKSKVGNNVTVDFSNGNISRKELISGEYTPADTKYVTNQVVPYYNVGGYKGSLIEYVASGEYTPADTKFVQIRRSGTSYLKAQYIGGNRNEMTSYNLPNATLDLSEGFISTTQFQYDGNFLSDGYTGVLSLAEHDGIEITFTGYTFPAQPILGQIYSIRTQHFTANYSGNITRPESDTRVFKWQGYVTKAESDTRVYRDYYKYIVTADYIAFLYEEYIKVNGEYKRVINSWIKIGGVWRKLIGKYTKVSGVWRSSV